ncbi:hypothetical protein HWI79_3182 [Cryptosporidium felis]|nr:hypothetical protein HWI79_3182 [Cryptosporidium felis]
MPGGCGGESRDIWESGAAEERENARGEGVTAMEIDHDEDPAARCWTEDGREAAMEDCEDERAGEEEDKDDNEGVFPLVDEPLRTFVTVNPATLEDEELWPLSSLKSLCEYVGLSVKGNRRCILSRLQTWNGAPLSGAGHPDLFDTRSARFHTVPMAFLEREEHGRWGASRKSGMGPEPELEGAGCEEALQEVLGGPGDAGESTSCGAGSGPGSGATVKVGGPEGDCLDLRGFHSPGIIKKMGALASSTPVNSSRREIKSCLNTSTPRKRHSHASKSAGRICFSPYNYVRVFLSNPGERELNIDPESVLRLVGDWGPEEELEEEGFFGETEACSASSYEGQAPPTAGGDSNPNSENSDRSNLWAGPSGVLAFKREGGK